MPHILKNSANAGKSLAYTKKIVVLLFGGLFPLIAIATSKTSLTVPEPNNLALPSQKIIRQSSNILQEQPSQSLYDHYPWSVMYYYGFTVNNPLIEVLTLNNLKRWPEHIQSFELAYTLNHNNVVRRFFYPVVGVVQLAGNFTIRNGSNEPTIYEFDPSIMFRWANFPWNAYIHTSFALAEGVSYDTSIPAIEKKGNNTHTKHLLNFMVVEITLAIPHYPRLQLVGRIHHRSGAFGLYHAGNTGSNDLALGIRYLFD